MAVSIEDEDPWEHEGDNAAEEDDTGGSDEDDNAPWFGKADSTSQHSNDSGSEGEEKTVFKLERGYLEVDPAP